MTDDVIQELSRDKTLNEKYNTPVLFPEIPDPPEGFDPEANILFKEHVPHSERVEPRKRKMEGMLPRARVFLVGIEGNEEYERILQEGIEGKCVLGKKEITDLRGSNKFKVYLEWIELPAKKED